MLDLGEELSRITPDRPKFNGIVRPLKREDLPYLRRILEMWVRWQGELLPEEVEDDMNQLRESLKGGNSRYLVAETLDGRVVGMMGLVPEPKPEVKQHATTERPVELVRAYVDQDFRGGQGVGTALIRGIEKLAKSQGATEILLDSGPRYKESGHGFYDKQGYQRIGVNKDFYGEGGDAVVWQKLLV